MALFAVSACSLASANNFRWRRISIMSLRKTQLVSMTLAQIVASTFALASPPPVNQMGASGVLNCFIDPAIPFFPHFST